MLGLATRPTFQPHGWVSKSPIPPTPPPERRLTAQALKRLRHRADLTQEAAAERAGVATISWRRYETAERPLSTEKLAQLAESIGFTIDDALDSRSEVAADGGRRGARTAPMPGSPPAGLPIRDRVQAGAWLMADDADQRDAPTFATPRDPRYPHADQWLSTVVGDSVDLLRIFDGDLVQCVDAIAIDYVPRNGDIVEVERTRFQGAERELTIKQVEIGEDGVARLWPRSSNPRWRQPIELLKDGDGPDHVEVRVRGLVVRSIRSF